jgi:acetylglutamate kinase
MTQPIVIKVGGNDLDREGFVPALVETVADLQQHQPCIVVHGGGRTINLLLDALGIEPTYVDGQRVTDAPTLDAAEMVLSGQVNQRLTLAFNRTGVEAQGLTGVDRGLIRVEPWGENLGLVGRVTAVRADLLHALCAANVVPVISPISTGPDGRYNVNADHAAGAVAGAIDAAYAAFVTNVPGVQVGSEVAPRLTAAEVEALIQQGIIRDGMIPKVNAARAALEQGVQRSVITDLPGLRAGSGTTIVQ